MRSRTLIRHCEEWNDAATQYKISAQRGKLDTYFGHLLYLAISIAVLIWTGLLCRLRLRAMTVLRALVLSLSFLPIALAAPEIDADKIDCDKTGRRCKASGNVVLTDKNHKIQAASVDVEFGPTPSNDVAEKSMPAAKAVTAHGPIVADLQPPQTNQPPLHVTAASGAFDPGAKLLRLTAPKASDKTTYVEATTGRYDVDKKILTLEKADGLTTRLKNQPRGGILHD